MYAGMSVTEIEANIYYWYASGMHDIKPSRIGAIGYVQVSEVTRLLELAHQKGYEARKLDEQSQKVKNDHTRG